MNITEDAMREITPFKRANPMLKRPNEYGQPQGKPSHLAWRSEPVNGGDNNERSKYQTCAFCFIGGFLKSRSLHLAARQIRAPACGPFICHFVPPGWWNEIPR